MIEEAKNFINKAIASLKKYPSVLDEPINYINNATELLINENPDSLIKTYALSCNDSIDDYNDISIALDDEIDMDVGEDLGMVAHLIPHSYARANPYKLRTSNKNIVDIDGMIMTAKAPGRAEITVESLNGKYTDSIVINVKRPIEFRATESETYYIEPSRFNLLAYDENNPDTYSNDQAYINSNAIKSIVLYAKSHNYKKIVFPENKTYYYDPSNRLYFKNNLIVDFNKSTLQVYPNILQTYVGIEMNDNENFINVMPRGWDGLSQSAYISYITAYGPNENGVNVYWKNSVGGDYFYDFKYIKGGESGECITTNYVNVLDSFDKDQSHQLRDCIIKTKKYKCMLNVTKYKDYSNLDKIYTSQNIEIEMLLYKNSSLVETVQAAKLYWNNSIHSKNITFTIDMANKDVNRIKFKVKGMSDPKYPVTAIIGDIKIYEIMDTDRIAENIIFENGYLYGDRYLKDSEGNEIKTKLFKEAYGKDWRNIQETEGSMNLILSQGINVGCRNMTIGNTPGFNIGIGNGKIVGAVYPSAKNFVAGAIDDITGEDIDKDLYMRDSLYRKVNISDTPYFKIADPTFVTTYYYGQRTRLIDVYFYDENKNYISCLKNKFRFGILKAPENTAYMRITAPLVQGETINTSGNSDFKGCVFAIKFVYPTQKCFFKKCNIINNYSCGMAHSGFGVLVEDCYFNNNVGRMPWSDVDSEDGWQDMQNNVFRNNSFNSYYGFIMCAGTNYILKNNTFNCPVKLWEPAQYYKIIGNTFKNNGYIGAGGIGYYADTYITKNTFESQVPVSIAPAADSNYMAYIVDNIFDGARLNLNTKHSYMQNNKLKNRITLLNSNNIFNNCRYDELKDITSIEFDANATISNCDFGKTKIAIKNKINIIFENCKFKYLPGPVSGFTLSTTTFNNCEITNPKIDSAYVYNNCNLKNEVMEEYLFEGMAAKNSLIFAQENAVGVYMGMQNDILKTGKSYEVCIIMKKGYNFGYDIIKSSNVYLYCHNNSVSCQIYYSNDGGVTKTRFMWSANYNSNIVGIDDIYLLNLTFNADEQTYTYYINNTNVYSKNFDKTKITLVNINDNITIGGQAFADYYFYNRILTDDERLQNYNAFKNIYEILDIVCDISSIDVGSALSIKVRLKKPIDINHKVCLSDINKILLFSKTELIFTPDNYNIYQEIVISSNYFKSGIALIRIYDATITKTTVDIKAYLAKQYKVIVNSNVAIENYVTGYYDDNGTLQQAANTYVSTYFIEIKPNTKYIFYSDSTYSSVNRYTFFDSNSAFISRHYSSAQNISISTPENAKFIKIGFTTKVPDDAFKYYVLSEDK